MNDFDRLNPAGNGENGRSLPDGWEWKTVNDLAEDIQYGYTQSANDEPVGPKFLRITDIQDGRVNWDTVPYCECSEQDIQKFKLETGDIVFARTGATTGKSFLIRECPQAVFASYLIRLRLKSEANIKYFYYFLQSSDYWSQIMTVKKGSAQPGVNATILATLQLPLAPFSEQEKIVSRIEELFSDLDAGMAALERVRAGLRRYKASVLKAAFEGRLVPQDESVEPATVLLERVLGKDYAKEIAPSESSRVPFIPTGWAYGKLEKLIYIAGRIGWRGLKADEYTQEGPLFLSVYNLNKGDHVDFSDTYHISQERYDESPEIILQENDILLAKDGAGIGKIGIVKDLPGQATVNSSLLVIRASEIFIPEFLFYLLKGPQMQDIVRARITGSATPHLFQRDIKKFTLLIPPLDEQRRIVAEVERRLSVVGEVESAVEVGLARSARLRQAVLRSAFEGRLP